MLNLDQITAAVKKVGARYQINSAYLFGSYARGNATKNSDIDLYVDSGLKGLKFVGFIENLRQALGGNDIDVFDTTHINADSKVLNEIKNSGILVYER